MGMSFAYEREPRRVELEVEPLAVGRDERGPWARLADSILYPGGGGQPADRGSIGGIEVLSVERQGDALLHRLSAEPPCGPTTLRLDWPRRFDHMQQHSAQHLLTALAADRFGWRTTSFHLGDELCDIELEAPSLSAGDRDRLEEAVAVEVRAARRIRAFRVPLAEMERLGARSRGLPEGFSGDARLVEIEGIDLGACGGTHLDSTAEIETLKLLGAESMRGGTRLFWVAGGRVRRRLAAHESRAAELRRILGAPDAELAAVAAAKLEALEGKSRELRHLGERLESLAVASLAAESGPLLVLQLDEPAPAGPARIAQRVAALRPEALTLVSAPLGEAFGFALVAGERCDVSVTDLGRGLASALGARGGGSGRTFQGKAPSFARLPEALTVLRAALAGASA